MYELRYTSIFPCKQPLSPMAEISPLRRQIQYYIYLTSDGECIFYRILLTALRLYYSGVIMSAMASQITRFSIVYSTVC